MSFADQLVSDSAYAPDASSIKVFGRFVGSWRIENSLFSETSGEWSQSDLVWTFAYVLGGRGVQDVLVDASGISVGTTVRTWDSVAGWRVVWFSPRSPEHCVLEVLETSTDAITMVGVQADGRRIRWEFSEIAAESFRWNGWCSNDDGVSWWHEQHMDANHCP